LYEEGANIWGTIETPELSCSDRTVCGRPSRDEHRQRLDRRRQEPGRRRAAVGAENERRKKEHRGGNGYQVDYVDAQPTDQVLHVMNSRAQISVRRTKFDHAGSMCQSPPGLRLSTACRVTASY
jgi:hypothetical protein